MYSILNVCSDLNALVNPSKICNPTQSIEFLGIWLDSRSMSASITVPRRLELLDAVHMMLPRRTCKKRDLLQLIGKLSFACKVVPAGRMFLRRLINKSTEVGPLHHHVTLGEDTRADLRWWLAFLPSWRGSSIFIHPAWRSPVQSHLFTDASSLCGFGAFYSGHWFSGSWDPVTSSFLIAWKELYAIVLAASTWGQHWRGQCILFHCDNRAVVDIWAKGSSKQPDIMSLVRALYFIVAHLEFHIAIKIVPGCNNSIADALSRFQVDHLRRLAPEADSASTTIISPHHHSNPSAISFGIFNHLP